MNHYFPKPFEPFGGNINVKVDLSNYATKAYLKNATETDTFKLALNSNLANLKVEINKIDVDKLKTVLIELSKLSNVVNNDVVKKTVYEKLVAKVKNIDTNGFVLKTKHDTNKSDLEKKIPDTNDLLRNLVEKHIIILKLLKLKYQVLEF